MTRSGSGIPVLVNCCTCSKLTERWFTSVAFSPDGTKVAATTYGAAHVWDVATGEHLVELEDIDAWSNGVAFTPGRNPPSHDRLGRCGHLGRDNRRATAFDK